MKVDEIRKRIQAEINPYRDLTNKEFEAPFFKAMAIEKMSFIGAVPDKFRWTPSTEHIRDLQAHFPEHGWRNFSFHHVCRKTPYNKETYLEKQMKDEMRDLWSKSTYSNISGRRCEKCGIPAEVIHHESPKFVDISARCIALIPRGELLVFDYWNSHMFFEKFFHWSASPLFQLFHEMHLSAHLVPLCKECHYTINKDGLNPAPKTHIKNYELRFNDLNLF
jgi:hypothetical protein